MHTHTRIHAHFFNRLTIYRALAVELAANASTLESLLQELADQEQSLRENLTQSENTNSETEPVISEVCTCTSLTVLAQSYCHCCSISITAYNIIIIIVQ